MSEGSPDNQRGAGAPMPWTGRSLTSFVGRDADVQRMVALLEDPSIRLITMTGPGGVGKTRLAEAICDRVVSQYPDGALFVDLSAIRDPGLVASAILRALGGEQGPTAGDIDTVVERLGDRRLLLVLDNMEQLLAAVPDVQQVLVRCPGMTALVTSRTLLRVRGEYEYAVQPLAASSDAESPAVRLLLDRTRAVQPGLPEAPLPAPLAAEICARVDGLPLAIELAAAQLRLLSPEQLLARLSGVGGLRGRGFSDLPDRQQTMEQTIDWSYRLLPEPLQARLEMLCIFSGGFSLESADALIGQMPEVGTLSTLETLASSSLIRATPRRDSVRFSILETIRAFGLSRLAERGDDESTRERHARIFLDQASRYGPQLRTETDHQVRVWQDLEADVANYRAAIEWFRSHGNTVEATRIVTDLDWFWTDSNYAAEGLRLISALSGSPDLQQDPGLRAAALRVQANLADMLGQTESLSALVEMAIEAAHHAGREHDLCELYHVASGALIEEDRLGAARAMARKTIETARERGQTWFVGAGEVNTALIETLSGNYTDAIAASQRGADAFRACGDRDLEQNAIISAALAWLLSNNYRQAFENYQAVLLRQMERIEESFYFQHVSRGIAAIVGRTGRPEVAARIFAMGDAEFARTGVTLRKPLQALFDTYRSEVRTALGEEAYQQAMSAGHVLTKSDAVRELLALPAPPQRVDRKLRPAPLDLLSNREYEVLHYLVAGKTDPEIANALFLSPRTVSQHVSNILGKLQVPNRSAAAAFAARLLQS